MSKHYDKDTGNSIKRLRARTGKLRDLLDFDYLKQLNAEELAWLVDFTKAYYRGSTMEPESVHLDIASEEAGADIALSTWYYRRNNERVRDIYNKGFRLSLDAMPEQSYEMEEVITVLIDGGFSVDEAEDLLRIWTEKACK